MKTLGVLVLLLLPLSTWAQKLTKEDYRIYRAFMEQDSSDGIITDSLFFFVEDSTVIIKDRYSKGFQNLIQLFPKLIPDSRHWQRLARRFSKQHSVPFESSRLNDGTLRSRPWTNELSKKYLHTQEGLAAFFKDFPKGTRIVTFSKVRTDGKRALFYFTDWQGPLAAASRWVLMRREPGGWKLVRSLLVRIS